MSDETARLKLAQLVSLQELNAVTWNEALAELDALVDLYLLGQFVDTPPASPQDGDAYLIGGSPTGAWSGHAYKIAACLDGAWRFYQPFNGLRAYVAASGSFVIYLNGVWADVASLTSANEVSIAAAAVCDLGAANALFVQITGTTAITSFGTGANKLRFVRFAQALTLTHNATALILLGGASRTTAAGDVGVYTSDASGNWRERSYARAASNPGDAATKSGSETLANKTLSSPVLTGTVAGAATFSGTVACNNVDANMRFRADGSAALDCGIFVNATGRFAIGAWGGTNYLQIHNGTNTAVLYLNSADAFAIGTSDFSIRRRVLPATDNAFALGGASARWTEVFAATGTINTSGETAKTGIRALSAAELAVARRLAGSSRVFRYLEAVARKGADARLHCGMVFEEVTAAFAAEGLEPMRYGILCRDPALRPVVKMRPQCRRRMECTTEEIERLTVRDGVAVLERVVEAMERPVFNAVPVVDTTGAPVIDPATGRQRIHFEPAYETVDERCEELEPDTDESGAPKWTLGLRYGELAQFVIAGFAARLDALEGA